MAFDCNNFSFFDTGPSFDGILWNSVWELYTCSIGKNYQNRSPKKWDQMFTPKTWLFNLDYVNAVNR